MEGDDFLNSLFKKDGDISSSAGKFKEYQFDSEDWLDRSAIWYGASGGGKTIHMMHVINLLHDKFPKVIVFCPTAEYNKVYKNKVDDMFVYTELTPENFERVYSRQKEVVDMYINSCNYDVAKEVFDAFATREQLEASARLHSKLDEEISKIHSSNLADMMKAQKINNVTEDFKREIVVYYKACLLPVRNQIDTSNLSQAGANFVLCMDLNPRILLVFDDCQEEIKDMLSKKKSNCALFLRNLFSRGRHMFVTHFYTFQDDTILVPFMRKNAFVSVLTRQSEANTFIPRAANGIEKGAQKIGLELVRKLFQGDTDFRKMLYFREKKPDEMFQHYTASRGGVFTTGSLIINSFCENVRQMCS